MTPPRQVPIFDAHSPNGSWNQNMAPGEYAVHYSSFAGADTAPFCTVFPTLDAAESHASDQIAQRPALRCTVYDHHGLIGPPLRDLRGPAYKGHTEPSPRFRRWAGSILFFGGILLILYDWSTGFALSWPAMTGSRMLIPGTILLLIEAVILLTAIRERRRKARTEAP